MNDSSAASKVNVAEKNERNPSGKRSSALPENPRPNLSESAEKTSAPETKVKAAERRNSPKAMTKNQNLRQARDRPRREYERRQGGSERPGRRNDSSYGRGAAVTGGGGGGNFPSSPSPQPANRDSVHYEKKMQGKFKR